MQGKFDEFVFEFVGYLSMSNSLFVYFLKNN